jgi:hypothetical protein
MDADHVRIRSSHRCYIFAKRALRTLLDGGRSRSALLPSSGSPTFALSNITLAIALCNSRCLLDVLGWLKLLPDPLGFSFRRIVQGKQWSSSRNNRLCTRFRNAMAGSRNASTKRLCSFAPRLFATQSSISCDGCHKKGTTRSCAINFSFKSSM